MFDLVANGVVVVLFAVFATVAVTFIWLVWQVIQMLPKVAKTIVAGQRKAQIESISREELYHLIAYSELRGEHKAAKYWEDVLERKYPKDV